MKKGTWSMLALSLPALAAASGQSYMPIAAYTDKTGAMYGAAGHP